MTNVAGGLLRRTPGMRRIQAKALKLKRKCESVTLLDLTVGGT
jgi:hypothetical protein